ncbi:Sulfiredoxin [Operophtera brumata]|uniref:Sulfiredoxin n=1 Tax=Operophtera brumata TaxID=104452 RepID=A0A0L7LJU9_OPEBR|nr:Sulfiredoxin [Operophtera brumata]
MCRIARVLLLFSIAAARMTSVHSAYKNEVHDVPMSVIIRPFIPELDEKKVESLMETIQARKAATTTTVSVAVTDTPRTSDSTGLLYQLNSSDPLSPTSGHI